MANPLLSPPVLRAVERAATAHLESLHFENLGHLARAWTATGFTDLNDRASHPCGIFAGTPFSVFAKLYAGAEGAEQASAELRGLALIRELSGAATPIPIAAGAVVTGAGILLLSEALPERDAGKGLPASSRTAGDYAEIGRALARLHQARGAEFGLPGPGGFFGPLRQDNRRVAAGRWAGFYAERRMLPMLRAARDSGHLPAELVPEVERIVARLPRLCGPEPVPALLHGDAQQNNFVSVPGGAVLIDVCPYFGHPEIDLALVDYFQPVPDALFQAYSEIAPIDAGFAGRRELWRLFGYLAVVAVDGGNPFGRSILPRIAAAVRQYS
jgi:fructosamine-3-kinase